jgi:TonB family protein
MDLKIISAAVAIALTPQAAHAAEVIGAHGDWQVFRDSKSCGMTRDYDSPGETQMTVIKYTSDNVRIMITNAGWSAKRGELYDISYRLNRAAYGGAKAVGTAGPDRGGFVSTFVAAFADDFAKGSALQVLLAGKEIERLSLNGSGAAMALVDQCLESLREASSAVDRERGKRAQLPKDPFAPAPGKPAPIGDVSDWTALERYPPAALRERREGVTGFRLTVGTNGRVTNCRITRSSGHADLDQAACENARRKARFEPATDAQGKPVTGTFDLRTTWKLPKD